MHSDNIPIVAIVGRPNVGKSTLFNRLIGRRKAIVENRPGTTRDIIESCFEWDGKVYALKDGSGWLGDRRVSGEMEKEMKKAVELMVREAELVLFICDASTGLVGSDQAIADKLRRWARQVVVVVNKVDHERMREITAAEFYKLGFKSVVPVSALHGLGISELCEAVQTIVNGVPSEYVKAKDNLTIAIVGEPNVGKSTYLNAVFGQMRAIVSSTPGTTRDTIEAVIPFNGTSIRLIDTAGAQRRRKVKESVRFYSQNRTGDALRESDVVLLIFDVKEGLGRNARTLIDQMIKRNKTCVLAANKWDTVEGKKQGEYRAALFRRFKFLKHCPLSFISAKEKRNLEEPLKNAVKLWRKGQERIQPQKLMECVHDFAAKTSPPGSPAMLRVVQDEGLPLTFTLFIRGGGRLDRNYLLAFQNHLREKLELGGTFFRMKVKSGRVS